MNEAKVSLTALGASLMRAVHTRLDRPALIHDPWGDTLVPDSEREAIRDLVLSCLGPEVRERIKAISSPEAALDAALRAHPRYDSVIVRSRYTEDALQAAIARGAGQYVIIGAGMDSFVLRRPPYARELEVFEVDHPASQGFKRKRLKECGIVLEPHLHFIPADLRREDLGQALGRAGFRSNTRAFFSWLGVTTYLTREANLQTLRAIADCACAGSELVFTYIDQDELDSTRYADDMQRLRKAVASTGEPWVSGFRPSDLARDLRSVGLVLLDDLDASWLQQRYYGDRPAGPSSGPGYHIVRVEVAKAT